MAAGSLETIFTVLEHAGVRYLVVGGVAVVLHGHPRFTADLDLVLALDTANIRAALSALAGLGYRPRAPVPADDFADPAKREEWIRNKGMVVFSLASPDHPATEVDLFVEEPFPFEAAHRRATWADLGDIRVAVASIPDLVEMKRRAGRARDLDDVRQLEEIARDLERSNG
ncbi:MAG: nucleotidyl transferase AbiEii/AbiGii toxin family protein [Myxococcota bacterium]